MDNSICLNWRSLHTNSWGTPH